VALVQALRDAVEAEEMAVLALPGLVQKLKADATLELLRGLLVDNEGLDGDRRDSVGVEELKGEDPNISHGYAIQYRGE